MQSAKRLVLTVLSILGAAFILVSASKPESREKDPLCTSGSDHRVIRGGSWRENARNCQSSSRVGVSYVIDRLRALGFRYLGFRPSMSR